MANLNLIVGWGMILLAFLIGAYLGIRAQNENWLGGYASLKRRLIRLGHIALAALGMLNIIVWILFRMVPHFPQVMPRGVPLGISSRFSGLEGIARLPDNLRLVLFLCFVVGAILMPMVCFLSALDFRWRYLFPIPVVLLIIGSAWILLLLI